MAVPLKEAFTVGKYIATQRIKRVEKYPLVLMLEPLYHCNLACPGCGKIQHPDGLLKVRVGRFTSRRDADELARQLRRRLGDGPFVVEEHQ